MSLIPCSFKNLFNVSKLFTLKLITLSAALILHGVSVKAETRTPLTLTFGIYAAVKPTEQINKLSPVTKALQGAIAAELKRPVEIKFKVAATYQEGLKDIVEGKVDFSRLGPASYIEATNSNSKLELVAAESKNGSTTDYGIICVKDDSAIKTISDLKGKKFAFGDEASTIGRYLSQQYLLQNGIKATDFAKFEYLGRHDAVAAAVGAGVFDAGAVKEETFQKVKAAGTALRELARFPNASQTWVAKNGLEPEVLAALQTALLGLKDENALKAIDADQVVKGNDTDYKIVREAMAANPSFFK